MFKYTDFFYDILTEVYYGKVHTFDDLPKEKPYGFMIYPDGTFGIARFQAHDLLVGGSSKVDKIILAGGIRATVENDTLWIQMMPKRVKSQATKTANDLASWYNLTTQAEYTELSQLEV